MKNLSVSLTIQQRNELKNLIKQYTHPWQIAKRLETIRLLDSGLTVSTICDQLCIHPKVVYRYVKAFKQKGFEGLINLEKPGKESKLSEKQMLEIEEYIAGCHREGKRCTSHDQAAYAKERFGVEIGSKWIAKRLLLRKQTRFERTLPAIGIVTPLLVQLSMIPGWKRYTISGAIQAISFFHVVQQII